MVQRPFLKKTKFYFFEDIPQLSPLLAAKGTWHAKIENATNEAVQKLGFLGNIGSR